MNSSRLQRCLKSKAIGFPCWRQKYIKFQIDSSHAAVNWNIPTSNLHRFVRIHWIYWILLAIFIILFIFFNYSEKLGLLGHFNKKYYAHAGKIQLLFSKYFPKDILHYTHKLTSFVRCHKITVVYCKEIKLCQVLLQITLSIWVDYIV